MANFRVMPGKWAPIKMWTNGVPVEDEALRQLERTADLEFIFPHIAVMPDVHVGKGATVGSVIPTLRAIIPAAVGVDLGCGMQAVRTNLKAHELPDSLLALRTTIESIIPHGRTDNGGANDRGAWGDPPSDVLDQWADLKLEYMLLLADTPQIETRRHPAHQLGTLGTGNHFIEVCLDKEDRVWVMLHSGSRGPGNRIGTHFISKAKELCNDWFITLPESDLAYLAESAPEFELYCDAVLWAQKYALANRNVMMRRALTALAAHTRPVIAEEEVVDCHHNYIAKEHHFGENVWVTRKGAVRARKGDLGIIPGSMGARSFIVRGLGNPQSLCSCSHGAGRKMSRTAAKKLFSVEDHAKATQGIECRKDVEMLDESPGAYKSIDDVMAAQSDLVEIVHELHQVLCVKG